MATVLQSVKSFFAKLGDDQQQETRQRQLSAKEKYAQLVRQIADGEHPPAATIHMICASLEKSFDDLEADVEAFLQARPDVEVYRNSAAFLADRAGIATERQRLEAEISAAAERLEACKVNLKEFESAVDGHQKRRDGALQRLPLRSTTGFGDGDLGMGERI